MDKGYLRPKLRQNFTTCIVSLFTKTNIRLCDYGNTAGCLIPDAENSITRKV